MSKVNNKHRLTTDDHKYDVRHLFHVNRLTTSVYSALRPTPITFLCTSESNTLLKNDGFLSDNEQKGSNTSNYPTSKPWNNHHSYDLQKSPNLLLLPRDLTSISQKVVFLSPQSSMTTSLSPYEVSLALTLFVDLLNKSSSSLDFLCIHPTELSLYFSLWGVWRGKYDSEEENLLWSQNNEFVAKYSAFEENNIIPHIRKHDFRERKRILKKTWYFNIPSLTHTCSPICTPHDLLQIK